MGGLKFIVAGEKIRESTLLLKKNRFLFQKNRFSMNIFFVLQLISALMAVLFLGW
jgi:hypothetical protein